MNENPFPSYTSLIVLLVAAVVLGAASTKDEAQDRIVTALIAVFIAVVAVWLQGLER